MIRPAHACWHKPLCIGAKHARDQVFYFWYGSIILPGLWAFIGITHSNSSHLFLCTLGTKIYYTFQWLLSCVLHKCRRRLSVTNLSLENNLPTFCPDDNWSIQSKRWQVIFQAIVGNRYITFIYIIPTHTHTHAQPFGSILDLVPKAESVIKLKAVCMVCFKDAAFTKRLGSETEVSTAPFTSVPLGLIPRPHEVWSGNEVHPHWPSLVPRLNFC